MTRILWLTVICGGAIMGLTMGLRQGVGLYLAPISSDLGIGRETFALAIGLMNLVWGLGAPVSGALADRYGAAKVAAAGGVFYAAGLATMTLSGTGWQLITGGILVGLGLSGAGFSVILGTVGKVAPEHLRTQALGIASMGGSIGQFVLMPYAYMTIALLGWNASLLVLASSAALIVPLAMGLARQAKPIVHQHSTGFTGALAGAGRERGFWLLSAGFFVCGFHLAFVAVHLPAYLEDLGFEAYLAMAALTGVGFFNIIGTYCWGILGDRYPKKNMLALLYLARSAILLAFFMLPVSEFTVIAFGCLMGLLWLGTVPLTSGLVATLFGTAHMSMLFGMVFLGHQIGGFLGSWVAGLIYDQTGDYSLMWWASIILGVVSALLHWPISEQPSRAYTPAPESA